MSLHPTSPRWCVLALAVALGACRDRTPPPAAVDWKAAPGARAEAAALLLLDKDGMANVECLPGRRQAQKLFPGVALGRILDVHWQGGPMVAGVTLAAGDVNPGASDELVLLLPSSRPRRLAKGVRTARFSPDGGALAYEVVPPGNDGAAPATSYVLALDADKVTELGPLADPLWEADGKHLRATRLRTASDERRGWAAHWPSVRVRWNRISGATTMDGPGASQIPAPAGEAVAWSQAQPGKTAPSQCTVYLSRLGGVMHSIVGKSCMGIADDREARWSPDGRHLAFPHPGRLPGQQQTGGFIVDVVGIEGGRYPALTALHARARPEQLAIATAPGSVWFDWSPSGRFLALHDGASDLRVYDLEAHGVASLGKGEKPMWSPGGGYLLVQAAGHAIALPGVAAAAKLDLGPARDARWLPAQACDNVEVP
jgi:hypothetical protein